MERFVNRRLKIEINKEKSRWLKPMTQTFWVLPSKVPKLGGQTRLYDNLNGESNA
jgi:hypothetical protein